MKMHTAFQSERLTISIIPHYVLFFLLPLLINQMPFDIIRIFSPSYSYSHPAYVTGETERGFSDYDSCRL